MAVCRFVQNCAESCGVVQDSAVLPQERVAHIRASRSLGVRVISLNEPANAGDLYPRNNVDSD
jgi:hypothetical protein